jgi:hypothetical protein
VIYLSKTLINVDELFDGSIDGRHGWVRKWVLFNVGDADVAGGLFGHSGAVEAELVALGANLSIAEQVVPFVRKYLACSVAQPFVLLIQRSGFFVLGVLFADDEFASAELTAEGARARMDNVSVVVIMNLS